jgi:hypothetical protein
MASDPVAYKEFMMALGLDSFEGRGRCLNQMHYVTSKLIHLPRLSVLGVSLAIDWKGSIKRCFIRYFWS